MVNSAENQIHFYGGRKLPSDFVRLLKEYGKKPEDFLFIAPIDLDENGHFTSGYICLGKDEIFKAVSVFTPGEVRFYKGTEKVLIGKDGEIVSEKVLGPGIKDYDVTVFPLDEIKSIHIERNVAGASLIGDSYKQDDEIIEYDKKSTLLCVVSNRVMGGMTLFERIFNSYSENGEVDENLYKIEKKDEFCPKCGMMYPDNNRKICPKCLDKKSIFMRVLSYLKKYWFKISIEFVCYLVTAVLNLVWPYLSGKILYDQILSKKWDLGFSLPGGDYMVALLCLVITMFFAKVLIQAVGILQGCLTAKITPFLVRDLKNDVFKSMGKLSVKFYNSKETGSLMTRVLGDADEVMNFFTDGLPYFIINVFTIIATAIIMFRMNVMMAVLSLIMMPIVFTISWVMHPKLWHRYGSRHRAQRSLNARIHDNLNGARVVRAFGQEEQEVKRFDKANKRFQDAELSLVDFDSKFFQLYHGAEYFASLLVWVAGSYLVLIKGEITLGVLITFTGYVNQLNGPMDFFSNIIRWYTNCMNAAERMFEIIDAKPDIFESENPVHIAELKGSVELRNVSFGYEPNRPVLKNVSFMAKEGEMLGIVGRSGAGKTTIVNLISRLYDPDEGEVFIDGVNVRDLSFDTIRGNIAMVSQESYIFQGSVADNIRYAKPDATDEEVIRAAVLASAHDFILRMPDGYDTLIGATGRTLSGGEKQRISIARAVLMNPKILILDEATAAVDTETEQAIQAAIGYLIKGRTTISIAHRLSTLRDASHLVVIDNGEVAEEGSHAKLLEKKGIYYKLRELQTKALALRD